MAAADSIETQKTGFTLIVNTIRCCRQMYISEQNAEFTRQLLELGLKFANTQSELQLNYDTFYKSLRELFGGRSLPADIFEIYVLTLLESLNPKKRSCEILVEALSSPCNYLNISTQIVRKFT